MTQYSPAAVLCLATFLVAGCGSSTSSAPTSTSTTTTPTSPVTAATKAPIHGLVAMGQEGFNSNPGLTPDNSLAEPNANANVYIGSVVLVTWKQLQATNGSTLDTSAIESGLSAIATYNTAHPSHLLKAKLRIFAGINSPVWVMNLDGAPLSNSASAYTIPRYWTTNYYNVWKSLQTQLAAIYDKDPRLAEVAVSGCASTTAEPFIRAAGTMDIPILKAAGYTDAQYMTCLSGMADQYSAWTLTPLDYTFNAFTHIDSGVGVIDTAYSIQVMTAWRTSLGTARGIVANHGLQPTLTSSAVPIYAEFSILGPPLEFQTYGPTVDWNATIAYGLTFHPTEIEIWTTTQAGGQAVITPAQLQLWASEI